MNVAAISSSNLPLNGTRPVAPAAQNPAPVGRDPIHDPNEATTKDLTAGTFCRAALSCDEVEEMVGQCTTDYPAVRVELAKRNAGLGWDYLGAMAGHEFSLDDFSRRFGPGEYRAVCKLPERKKKGLRFTIAAAEYSATGYQSSGQSVPAPSAGPTTEALLTAVLSKLSGPAPASSASPLDLNQLIIQQMQGQQNLLQALIVKTLDKPDPTGNKISELEAMLKLAERLGRRGSDDDASGESGGLLELGKTLATAWLSSGMSQAPAAAAAAASRAKQFAAGSMRLATRLQTPAQPQADNTLARAGGEATAHKTTGAGADTLPAAAPMNPIALIVRKDKRAQALATLISSADEDTQAESIADVAIGVLGDDIRQFVSRCPAGTFADMFLAAFPALESKRQFMRDVENKIRSMLARDAEQNADDLAQPEDEQDQTNPDSKDKE